MEVHEKGAFDDFDGVEMNNNEIEEATNCLPSVEEAESTDTGLQLAKQRLVETEVVNDSVKEDFGLPLRQYTRALCFPRSRTQPEHHKLWHQDTIDPSRKGWDVKLDGGPQLYQTVYGDLICKASHYLVIWEFYHLPFKIKGTSDWFKKKIVMQSCKCEEKKRSILLSFGDDRLDAPDIITWYKDRGKHFSSTS